MQWRRQFRSTHRLYPKKTAMTGETQKLQACRPRESGEEEGKPASNAHKRIQEAGRSSGRRALRRNVNNC